MDFIERLTEKVKKYCEENGIDYDELVEGASKNFEGTLEELREKEISQESVEALAKDIAEMEELSTKRVE